MAKKISDLTPATQLGDNDSFVFNDVAAGNDKRVTASSLRADADVVKVATVADLRNLEGKRDGQSAELLGYYTQGDGGGGPVYWDSTSTETANDGTIFQATGVTTGRWVRPQTNSVDVRLFGAKGDGITDNLPRLKLLRDYIAFIGGGEIVFSEGSDGGVFLVGDSYDINKDNISVKICDGVTLKSEVETTSGHTLGLVAGVFYGDTSDAVQRKNVHIYGSGSIKNTSPLDTENAVGIARCSNFSCQGITVPHATRSAVTIQVNSNNGFLKNINVGTTNWRAISAENNVAGQVLNNITIKSINVENSGDVGLFIVAPNTDLAENISVEDIYIKNSTTNGIFVANVNGYRERNVVIESSNGRGAYYENITKMDSVNTDIKSASTVGAEFVNIKSFSNVNNLTIRSASGSSIGGHDGILINNLLGDLSFIRPRLLGGDHKYGMNVINPQSSKPLLIEPSLQAGTSGVYSGEIFINSRIIQGSWNTFVDGATVPSVAGYRKHRTANTSSTSITSFAISQTGQEIIIYVGDSNTTFQHGGGGTLRLSGNVSYTPSPGAIISFVEIGGLFYEMCRS